MLKIKQIEKKIDSFILENIKDNCWDIVYETEVTEIGDTEHGKELLSRRVAKRKFNENTYNKLVREFYLNYIQAVEEEKKKEELKQQGKKTREKGRNITVREFFELVFRDFFDHRKGEFDKGKKLDEEGKVRGKPRRIYLKSFAVNIDPETYAKAEQGVARSIEKMAQLARKYTYFTPALFVSHKFFTKETLSLMGLIVLDFDLSETMVVMTREEIRQMIIKKLKVEPNFIWDTATKGNFQAGIMIGQMVGTPKSVYLYEQVVREMLHKLDYLVDQKTFFPNHLFRIPKNDRVNKKYVRKYNETVHDIKEFSWLLDERFERIKSERTVVNFEEERFLRDPAIDALLNGDVHYRDHGCFTAALVYKWLGKDESECFLELSQRWLPKVQAHTDRFDHSFGIGEVEKCVRSAYSGRYKGFKSFWVEYVTGIDYRYNGSFKWVPNQNEGKYVMNTVERIKKFIRENNGVFTGKIEEIAKSAGVSLRSVKRHLVSLREKGELEYETNQGRGLDTTFKLIEKPQIQQELVRSINTMEEQQESLEELNEAVMSAM